MEPLPTSTLWTVALLYGDAALALRRATSVITATQGSSLAAGVAAVLMQSAHACFSELLAEFARRGQQSQDLVERELVARTLDAVRDGTLPRSGPCQLCGAEPAARQTVPPDDDDRPRDGRAA